LHSSRKNSLINRIFYTKDRKEMMKGNSILSENFLNAVQTAYTLHAELNGPAENRVKLLNNDYKN